MQHSLPVITASLSDTTKRWEFLRYQLPGKSSAVAPAGSAGDIFPSWGWGAASLSHALQTNSCSVSGRAAAQSARSSCRQRVPPRVPSESQLEPVDVLKWELVLSSAAGFGHRHWMKHNLTLTEYWKHMGLGVKWAKGIFWVENQRR